MLQVNSSFDTQSAFLVPGPIYFVCCWVNHIGHIIMDMLVPAVLSVLDAGLSPSHLQYVVDNRFTFPYGSNHTILTAIQSFTGQQALPLKHYIDAASAAGKTAVCFTEFVAGMRRFDLLPEQPASYITRNDMVLIREMYMRKFMTVDDVGQMIKARTLVIEQRKQGRTICNLESMLSMIKKTLDTTVWNVHVLAFEEHTLDQQFALLARTDIFISVAGTGSHLSLFLPSQSVAVVVTSRLVRNVNARVCRFSPYTCIQVNATCCENEAKLCNRNSAVFVDMHGMEQQLLQAVARVNVSRTN
jgi:hypothetical protein